MNPIQSRRLSERNPQLWREWKARLKWRNLTATAIASALGQLTLLNSFRESWIGKVEDQQGLYRSIFQTLFWWALFLLMVMGSYLLVKDIAREEKRGTLAFLRLTPEPSGNILLGKLLGVPILLYLAIALALPLHLGIAIAAGLSPFLVLSFYLLAIAPVALPIAMRFSMPSAAKPTPGMSLSELYLRISYCWDSGKDGWSFMSCTIGSCRLCRPWCALGL